MLDKTAQDFRELHEERQALLKQFEDATDAISKRDIAIREASELYAQKKSELHARQTHLDEKARFLEAEKQNNKVGSKHKSYCNGNRVQITRL